MHDLESPLGHFVQLMSFPQDNEDELSLYAPCAFSIPDRVVNYGPEISALYSYNVHKHYFDTKRIALRDVYALHWKTWEHFSPTWFQRSHQKVRRDIYLLSSFIKSRRLLWTLLRSSQHFYEEGIKFYTHDQPTELYIGSSSPGILIPEEFYGEEIYYPGIGKHVAPNADIFDTQRDPFNSFINLRWILQEKIHNNVSVAYPFRIPYFTMGIGYNTKNKTINYSIFKSSAFATLRANKHTWAKKGKQAEYEEDIVALYKFFSRKIKTIKFLDGEKEDSAHHTYTLVSDNGFWYISERDPERMKIVKGALVNTYLIREMTKHLSSFEAAFTTSILGLVLSDSLYGVIVGLLPPLLVGSYNENIQK